MHLDPHVAEARFEPADDVLELAPERFALAIDRDNPRSLAWVAHTLRRRLARLAGHDRENAAPAAALPLGLPETLSPDRWSLEALCDTALRPAAGGTGGGAIVALLQDGADAAYALSDAIGARYFTHADSVGTSIGP